MPTARRCLFVVAALCAVAIARPAAATLFTYTIDCCYWNSGFDSLQTLPTTGTFSYNSNRLVPLSSGGYSMGLDTVLRLQTGPWFFELDPSLGPIHLGLSPQEHPLDQSGLSITGSFVTNVPLDLPSHEMRLEASKHVFSSPISAGTDLSVPIDFSFTDIGIYFPGIGGFTASSGLHLVSEPPAVAIVGLALIGLLALRRRA